MGRAMKERAEVIVIGAGVQGASLAFHLAQRDVDVLVIERSTVAAGATGRSSGFVRMHYDLEGEARLAWDSFPTFVDWDERVGAGDPGFVRTGFLQLVPAALADALRANVATRRRPRSVRTLRTGSSTAGRHMRTPLRSPCVGSLTASPWWDRTHTGTSGNSCGPGRRQFAGHTTIVRSIPVTPGSTVRSTARRDAEHEASDRSLDAWVRTGLTS
jgi:hypothetical protein